MSDHVLAVDGGTVDAKAFGILHRSMLDIADAVAAALGDDDPQTIADEMSQRYQDGYVQGLADRDTALGEPT